jgi:hypothetical protein
LRCSSSGTQKRDSRNLEKKCVLRPRRISDLARSNVVLGTVSSYRWNWTCARRREGGREGGREE